AAARKTHGDAAGTRALVEVLLLHRHLDRVDVVAGISAALSVGSTNADVVALEARKAAEHRAGAHAGRNGSGDGAEVLVLAQHRPGVAILDERPLPSVAQYDTLLNAQSS
ncbi:MAG: IS21 family transposase, partial [Mycobacterium sp.]